MTHPKAFKLGGLLFYPHKGGFRADCRGHSGYVSRMGKGWAGLVYQLDVMVGDTHGRRCWGCFRPSLREAASAVVAGLMASIATAVVVGGAA
jgi:hypothetical protein